ncbi:hsp70-binding protein 1-like [Lingula anatina]|uniref:Hsp70-binding protein 1-like n=1 Tax=Lingula anatina TaxID=7574 RepID=A0A1S3HXQ7_LINAN|nr:hsp70-binding protein 1-like [Lingula anatina]|eukprot:XP_013390817.1 hsp70-binding protein 1-like [Lingula anatina]
MSGEGFDRNIYPTDLRHLLKICLEQTKEEDATGPSKYEEMSEERRKWLEEAMKAATEDPVVELKECIRILIEKGDSEDEIEEKEEALEKLCFLCEDMDLSQDFHKIGGYALLPHLLHNDSSDIRWRGAELIANLCQNNPYCQRAALEANLLPLLIDTLEKDSVVLVKVKALYAMSCFVRGFTDGETAFMKSNGLSVLMRAMQDGDDKLKVKATFLLKCLFSQNRLIKDTLCDMGMVEQLVGLLSEQHNNNHEHFMNALLSLATEHQRTIEECQRPELHMKELLKNRIEYLTGKEEFLEEKEYAEQLEKMCFGSQSKKTGETPVNR